MSTPTAALARSETKQPRGLYLLANVEMWERFSYYGMRAFLVFFVTDSVAGFGWSKQEAGLLYGWYTGLVYLSSLLGGYLADRVLGTHRAILIGSFLIATGHFTLAIPSKVMFFVGLSLIVLGTGFHKSNISTMVGQQYKEADPRRDAAFTIFYMGINVGAMFGPIFCGRLAQSPQFGWHWGFASAGVGMVLGTVIYLLLKRRYLGSIGDVPAGRVQKRPGSDIRQTHPPLKRDEVDCIKAIAVMAFFNVFFWAAFEQTGSSLNFFARERTDMQWLGMSLTPSDFQSVNAICILVFAPAFAWLWPWLARRNLEPSTPKKFVLALLLVAAGFLVMVLAARLSEGGAKVSPWWLLVTYTLHTWGELCLSPVGLSMVTKLAPARYGSLMMGLWFTSFFVADLTAGILSGLVEKVERGELFHVLGGQADFFLMFILVPSAAALLLLAVSGKVNKLMHGRA